MQIDIEMSRDFSSIASCRFFADLFIICKHPIYMDTQKENTTNTQVRLI